VTVRGTQGTHAGRAYHLRAVSEHIDNLAWRDCESLPEYAVENQEDAAATFTGGVEVVTPDGLQDQGAGKPTARLRRMK
jgi:hypothetical protein